MPLARCPARHRRPVVRPLDHQGKVLEGVEIRRADSRSRPCGAAAARSAGDPRSLATSERADGSPRPSRVRRRPQTPVRASPCLADAQEGHLRLEAPARCRRLSVLTRWCCGFRHLRSIDDDGDVLEGRSVRGGCSASETRQACRLRRASHRADHPPRRGARDVRVQDSSTRGVQASGRGADADDGHLPLEASAGNRWVPVRAERQGGVADLRPLGDDGDVLEGIAVHGRRRADDDAQGARDGDARPGLRARSGDHRLSEAG